MTKLFALALFILTPYMHAEILIITHAFNRPDFIEIQHKTFKEFSLDNYRFVVFNDGKTDDMAQEISDTCARLNIECIRIPQEIHSRPYLYRLSREDYQHSCCRCANVVQYSLDVLGFNHDDIVMIIDSDMFMIKPFSTRDYMRGYQLAGLKQNRGEVLYLWNGFVCLDMRTLPNKNSINFNCGEVNGERVDVGGYTYYYIKNNPSVKIRYVQAYYSGRLQCDPCNLAQKSGCTHNSSALAEIGFDANQIKYIQTDSNLEFLAENAFLHYRCGGNWNNKSPEYHQMKTNNLHAYLTTILE